MSKREPTLYLEDIKLSIKKIENYLEGLDISKFYADEKTIDAIVRNLEIIGEAAVNMPEEIKIKYPELPWREMISMRNKVIHEYFGVDMDILWETATKNIPDLKRQINKIAL